MYEKNDNNFDSFRFEVKDQDPQYQYRNLESLATV